ncbi:hypothetical protein KY360_04280 [Candidatus Woesearchaeota archaeon]|nr:hypothetical protein [Candidatus Woesearchaeota archaeon]
MQGAVGDVPSRHHFIVKNGTRIKNLRELYTSLKSMDNITFNHHVNDFKNDFHNWVRDIHKDNRLASDLLAAKNRKEMVEHLKKRVEELQDVKEEVKAAETKIVKKDPRKKNRRKRKIAAEAQTKEMLPKTNILPERPIAKPVETAIQNTLVQHPSLMKLTVGDFMLGLLIGAIAGLIIARII